MKSKIESINYVPFYINNWKTIKEELNSKYQIPNDINRSTGTTTYDWNFINFGELYNEVQTRFDHLGMAVHRARFFYTAPGGKLDVHVDGTNKLGHYYWAINFPVIVPETDHYQEWYSYDGEYFHNYNTSYTDSTMLTEPKKIKLIDRLIINRPYLVKVGIPHAVYNNSEHPRLILSIRFYTDPSNTIKLIKSSIAQERFSNFVRKC